MTTEPLRILLVEDNPGDARLVREALRDAGLSWELAQVGSLEELAGALSGRLPAVILLDLSLPDAHGLETYQRAQALAPEVPVLVLTGLDDEAMAVSTVHEGAQDYLVKGELDGRFLARAIRYAIERKRAEQALLSSERQFRSIFEGNLDAIVIADDEGRFTHANPAACALFGLDREALLRRRISDFAEPGFDFERAWRVFQERGHDRGEFCLIRADGDRRHVEYSATASIMPGRHLSELHDMTARREAEKRLRAQARRQAAVAGLGEQALRETDLKTLLDEAAGCVAGVLEVEYASALELVDEPSDAEKGAGQHLRLRAGRGWPAAMLGRASIPVRPEYQAGYTLLSGEAVIVSEFRTDARFRPHRLLEEAGAVSGITVVIPGREQPFGVLCAHSTDPRSFHEDDVHFLQSVANVLAAAIERARSDADRVRLLASEREKSEQLTLAVREAHHRIKNNLQAISDLLYLEAAAGDGSSAADVLRESVERIQSIALVHDLLSKDEDVQTVDIRAMAERLVPMVLRSTGVRPEAVVLDLSVPSVLLSSKRATTLALILNELVSNAAKHALTTRPGSRLQVRLQQANEGLALRVQDSGPGLAEGFDLDRDANVGLQVVRTLAERDLGGKLTLSTGEGLTATVWFPW